MIIEDYCSFELAKLLKEKGFDEKCRSYYVDADYRNCAVDIDLNDFSTGRDIVLRPTHQMAMAWLREVHNMHIVVRISHSMFHSIRWYYDIYTLEDNDLKILKEQGEWCKVDLYNSYEEATEDAIKYCLENLI